MDSTSNSDALSALVLVIAMPFQPFQGYQGEMNPQVGHGIPGAEGGAQMMQLTQV